MIRPLRALLAPLSLCLMTALAADAHADRRIFGFTYGYMTLPQGGLEMEHYLDGDFALRDDPGTAEVEAIAMPDFEHQLEFEYGITDHWDFGLYQVFRQKPFDTFTYRGTKLRTRYRLFEEGVLPVDTAVYLEAVYKTDEVALEEILILGKRLDNIELAFNLKLEEEWKFAGPETEFEFKLVPSLGVGYHFNENVAVGAEYLGELVWEHGEFEHAHYAGPVISVAGRHFWWSVVAAPQLTTEAQPSFLVRSIFAVVF